MSAANKFVYINCPFGRKELSMENIGKHKFNFDKSKHVFVCDRFNTENIHMIERSSRVMREYLQRRKAINEVLSPIYNQRLAFDLDFKDDEYPEGLTVEDFDKFLNVMTALGEALNCSYRMAGYGRIPQNEIDELVKTKNYNIVYEENHKTHKVLSIHCIYNIIAKANQWSEILHDECYITNGKDEVKIDTAIYQNKNHLLRFPFSNKVDQHGTIPTAINTIKSKDYKKWLVCVGNGDEDIDNDKLEILKKWVVIKQKPNNNDAINNKTTQQFNDGDNKPVKPSKYKGPSIEEPNIKLPTGLIYKILKLYPMRNLSDIMFLEKTHDNYMYEELKDVLYKAYNKNANHDQPNKLNDYAKAYIGTGTVSNEYFIELIKPFRRPVSFVEYLDDNDFDIEKYEASRDVKLNRISKEKREIIKNLFETRKQLRNEYIEKYGNNETYKEYKRILNVFRVFETPYVEGSRFNFYFDDSKKMEFQYKRKHTEGFFTCPKDRIHLIDSSAKIDKILVTSKSEYEKLKQKYLFINDANINNGQRLLDIFKSGFVHEYDFNVYMDFVRSKLLNPKKLYIKNFVCYEGRDSLKTTFINMLSEYISVGIVPVNLIHSQFNGYMDNSICVYEELPASIKESRTVIEQLKAMTSTRKISLHIKGRDSETIENYCNIIINTNHKEVGGLFDNQADCEMFKRFYIIEKTPIERSLINEFFTLCNDTANIAACFEIIKQLKPLTTDDINNTTTQEDYYAFVRNTQNNKQCLDRFQIENTISKGHNNCYYVLQRELHRYLTNNGIITSNESERQQLLKLNIIQYDPKDRKARIQNIEKYFLHYVVNDTPDEEAKMYKTLRDKYGVKLSDDKIAIIEELNKIEGL